MDEYRRLTSEEVVRLKAQMCVAEDWDRVMVAPDFCPKYVRGVRFSGDIRLGTFRKSFAMAGGMRKHSGIYHATLHNVTVGDDCCIENVKNYIANYEVGHDSFIENVDIILTDGVSTFGNGVEVSVLNETGGSEVMIHDRLTAQTAYLMALCRHDPKAIAILKQIVRRYVDAQASSVGRIGSNVTIVDAGYIKNVRVGDHAQIEGASRLKNGSINSNVHAPVHVGVNVIGDDFIISSGSCVEDGVTFSRCFIGQACRLGHNYSATDSLFFSNCQGENGEACAIFAGPFTVTHHKSTLLIAGMFSFMNAGSGSNQSNHMYKLGPIHQGVMERGAKTASDSYILWPARVGAFSLVMGRHVSHQDTSDLPFAYLIEQQNTTYIMPGANLKSVGTIRDAKKWPRRDARTDPDRLDQINCNLLSPYTVRKMLRGTDILKNLQRVSGEKSESYAYQSGVIRRSSLLHGLKYYGMAIDKFLGNSLITRIMNSDFSSLEELRLALVPSAEFGAGEWMDISGLIAPADAVDSLMTGLRNGDLNDIETVNQRFALIHGDYYEYEWKWAYRAIEEYYDVDLMNVSVDTLMELVGRWRTSVVELDNLVYEDARKDFCLDFLQPGRSSFEENPFVASIREHIRTKMELGERTLKILRGLKREAD